MSKIHGTTAIDYTEAKGLTLGKHTDPTEEARTGLTVAEAREIAREDPGLIYCDTAQQSEAGEMAADHQDMQALLEAAETEAEAIDQDWAAGQTIARFADGSRIVFSEGEAEVLTAADWASRKLGDDG